MSQPRHPKTSCWGDPLAGRSRRDPFLSTQGGNPGRAGGGNHQVEDLQSSNPSATSSCKIANCSFFLQMHPETPPGVAIPSKFPFFVVQLVAFAVSLGFCRKFKVWAAEQSRRREAGGGGVTGIAPISSPLTRTALRLKEPEALQACSPALKLTGILIILIIIIMKLMEVEGGLDNRALVLVVGLKGLKQLSRLSLERKGHPILSRPLRLEFRLL